VTRYPDFVKRWAARRSKGKMADTSAKRDASRTPQHVSDPRAKSQRKGKVTADRWNQ
jgi:hypothetical protein